jgi:hypothetical protein
MSDVSFILDISEQSYTTISSVGDSITTNLSFYMKFKLPKHPNYHIDHDIVNDLYFEVPITVIRTEEKKIKFTINDIESEKFNIPFDFSASYGGLTQRIVAQYSTKNPNPFYCSYYSSISFLKSLLPQIDETFTTDFRNSIVYEPNDDPQRLSPYDLYSLYLDPSLVSRYEIDIDSALTVFKQSIEYLSSKISLEIDELKSSGLHSDEETKFFWLDS